jgi:hypothetical protein
MGFRREAAQNCCQRLIDLVGDRGCQLIYRGNAREQCQFLAEKLGFHLHLTSFGNVAIGTAIAQQTPGSSRIGNPVVSRYTISPALLMFALGNAWKRRS